MRRKVVFLFSNKLLKNKSTNSELKGFTLIEVLVALVVFSIMAVIAYGGLSSVVETRTQLAAQQDEFKTLIRSVTLLERDLREAVARSVRGNYGEPTPAIVGDADHMELTRTGFANPQSELRSNLERVVYRTDQQKLERGTYPVLDRSPATNVRMITLSERINSFRLRYLDSSNRWWDVWPPPRSERLELLPRTVEFRLDITGYGKINRLVELVSTTPSIAADAPFTPAPTPTNPAK